MTEVWADKGLIFMGERNSDDGPECLTADEARARAGELLRVADECERQQAETEARCEREGHDWGPWLNGYAPFRNHARYCQRGCTFGHEQEPGWMPFAAKFHRSPFDGRRLECCGPGCEWCDAESLAPKFAEIVRRAAQALEQACEVPAAFQKRPI